MATFDGFEFVGIEEMLQEVSPDEVPGCPRPLVFKHVRKAALDFCRRTQWFRATLDPITTVKGITEYTLDGVPDDVKFNSVLWVKLGGRELAAHEYDLSDDGLAIVLAAAPAETVRNNLEIRAVLEPSKTFQTLEKNLFESWSDAIAAGALGRLRRIPGRHWSNPSQAMFDSQEYENGITRAKNEIMRDRKNTVILTQSRKFAI